MHGGLLLFKRVDPRDTAAFCCNVLESTASKTGDRGSTDTGILPHQSVTSRAASRYRATLT